MVSKLTNKLGGPFGGRDAICQASVAFDSATSIGSSILIVHLKWDQGWYGDEYLPPTNVAQIQFQPDVICLH